MIVETMDGERTIEAVFKEFIETKIYAEYFDHRLYLIELYLDAVTRILDQRIAIKDILAPAKISLDGYIQNLIERYSYVMSLEESYFQ